VKRALLFVARALRLRCPSCGEGTLFASWFSMRQRCPACGLRLERDEGYFLGAMTFNLIAAELLFAGVMVAVLVSTWPSPPWDLLWVGSVVGMVLAPVVFYPFSKTLWLAFDLLFRPAPSVPPAPGRALPEKEDA